MTSTMTAIFAQCLEENINYDSYDRVLSPQADPGKLLLTPLIPLPNPAAPAH